jgi:hypothetical protein
VNYIHLINQFWRTRRSRHLTSITADLYYFLIHECNEQEWSNPFECPNGLIQSSIGISESALSDARNRLKQLGLIDYQPGKRNERAPVYRLFYPFKNGKTEGKEQGKTEGKTEGKHPNIIKETKPKPKPKVSDTIVSGAEVKKSNEVTEYWQLLVDTWFRFYKQKKGEDPTFSGPSQKSLKAIVKNLKTRSTGKGRVWNEQSAPETLQMFLEYAYGLNWIKDNFLLTNLERQFDKIISSNGQEPPKTGKPATGANVSTASAFATIDRMFGGADSAGG